jgi:hypothetical protein
MGERLQRAWNEFLRNIDIYIIIIVAIALSILGIVGTASVPLVLSGTLATLAVIAISILKNRQADETIERTLERLTNAQRKTSALDFFAEWDEILFRQKVDLARELDMLAVANHDFVSGNEDLLRSFVKRGGRIRYLLVNQEALVMAAARAFGAERDPTYLQMNNVMCLKIVGEIAKEFPASVEIKLVNHLPSAVITMLDPQDPNGTIFATLYGFNQIFTSRPSFALLNKRDGKWFEFYRTYFENLWNWNGCEVFDPAKPLTPVLPKPQASASGASS